MSEAPAIIQELVDRYSSNSELYRSAAYNEEQTRAEFINPFFEALGWDVRNKAGYSPAYMDVVFEGTLRVEGSANAPDYTFRVGQTRKFFAEAKKPNVVINLHPDPARQIRRYSWNAKFPLGILTNFAELAVYDCRVPPKPNDQPSYARLKYIKYTEYPQRWDEIASIFSRDAVWKGSFDKYVATVKGKRGTAEVDQEFLKQIEEWRTVLARNLALRNPRLDVRELNYAVQNTIDRIVFLRICEDRGIEPQGQLTGRTSGPNVYGRLVDLYISADHKYNSGLFHFSEEKGRGEAPDTLTTGLKIDDKVLRDIIAGLYYPKSPYDFAIIGVDILGNVYEQFLGKVIRLTPAHAALVEEKPEVKKAGGVYYTPAYITDYIVKNTVGKLCEGKTPKQVAKLRIVDPACGSGSFLINAYAWLLNWHLDYYVKDGPENHKKEVYRVSGSEWRLATKEKKRILLNNIYGVDIDSQAVEVTKLSLLLKVLEGESRDTLDVSLGMFHERALPDLSDNIKCGNSLIGTDFDTTGLSEDEVRRINPFDWTAEFPAIMKKGGFDAVIGNPPWGGDIDRELGYYHLRYPATTQEHTDSFKLFIDQAIRLSTNAAFVSMIVPSTLLRQRRLKDVRQMMLGYRVVSLVDLGENVFPRVVAPSAIYVLQKCEPDADHQAYVLDVSRESDADRPTVLQSPTRRGNPMVQRCFEQNADLEFRSAVERAAVPLVALGNCTEVSVRDAGINYQRVSVGMQEKGKSDLADRLLYAGSQQDSRDRMYWKGADIDRYWMSEQTDRFCRPYYNTFIRSNEVVHLSVSVYDTKPKILLRQTADRVIATIDNKGVWFGRSIIAIVPKDDGVPAIRYFLGLLNSRYFAWVYDEIAREAGRVFAQVKLSKLKQLPIRTINFDDPADKARHDKMVELVDRMLDLHKKLDAANVPGDKTAIQRRIDATDREIDALVHELYGLTDDEIKIVEGEANV